eukprot:gene4929-4827_t
MLEASLSQLEQLVSDLVQQNQALVSTNQSLTAELAQAKDENESLQLSLMEQEEKQGATVARIQALVERVSAGPAPAGEEQTLLDAALMLKAALAETKKKYPTLIGDRLLVLAAMNLCSQQIELQKQHKLELDRYQEQVSATVEVISKAIGNGD